MMNKLSSIITVLIVSGVVFVAPVAAQSPTATKDQIKMIREEAKNQQKAIKKNAKDQIKDLRQLNQASKSAQKKNKARINKATVTAITGTTLTITKDGKTYTVSTSAATKLRRHFGGASSLAEYAVNNVIDVHGQWSNVEKTAIAATSIRNRSVMKRRGTFHGSVVSKNGNNIVIASKNRGNQTATVTATTKYVARNQTPLTLNDIAVGHKIRIKGIWDKSNNTLTQVTQIKDFSLPPKATPSAATQ
jgi:hypothetical protein